MATTIWVHTRSASNKYACSSNTRTGDAFLTVTQFRQDRAVYSSHHFKQIVSGRTWQHVREKSLDATSFNHVQLSLALTGLKQLLTRVFPYTVVQKNNNSSLTLNF